MVKLTTIKLFFKERLIFTEDMVCFIQLGEFSFLILTQHSYWREFNALKTQNLYNIAYNNQKQQNGKMTIMNQKFQNMKLTFLD